jgi:hypothetical protein
VASASTNERDAWWEIAAGTGDTTATGELGLHWGTVQKGRGPRVQGGRGGISYTKEAAAEIEKATRDAEMLAKRTEIIERNRVNAGRPMPESNKLGPKQGGGGGGMEYAILVVVATIESVAFTILSQMLIEKLYSETELLIDWLEAGGFREAVGQP